MPVSVAISAPRRIFDRGSLACQDCHIVTAGSHNTIQERNAVFATQSRLSSMECCCLPPRKPLSFSQAWLFLQPHSDVREGRVSFLGARTYCSRESGGFSGLVPTVHSIQERLSWPSRQEGRFLLSRETLLGQTRPRLQPLSCVLTLSVLFTRSLLGR